MGRGPEQISEFLKKHARTAVLAMAGAGVGVGAVGSADWITSTGPALDAILGNMPREEADRVTSETGLSNQALRDLMVIQLSIFLVSMAGILSVNLTTRKGSVSSTNHSSVPQTSA